MLGLKMNNFLLCYYILITIENLFEMIMKQFEKNVRNSPYSVHIDNFLVPYLFSYLALKQFKVFKLIKKRIVYIISITAF